MTTSADVVNQALQDMNAQDQVLGTPGSFTGPNGSISSAAQAANILYTASVNYMLREMNPEFSRIAQAALTPYGSGPTSLWLYAYTYPADCLRLRQVMPRNFSVLDPQPVTWTVVAASGKAIYTNIASATATYTSSSVTETQFDLDFQTALVKFLASRFAMVLAGRPDFSMKLAEQAQRIGQEGFGQDS